MISLLVRKKLSIINLSYRKLNTNLWRNDDRLCVGSSDRPDVGQRHRAPGQLSFAKLSAKSKIAQSERKF